ncbi:MAG: hypothetical protein AAGF24_02140 [Cyanobacteria bacterium P01_H01_bin.121]
MVDSVTADFNDPLIPERSEAQVASSAVDGNAQTATSTTNSTAPGAEPVEQSPPAPARVAPEEPIIVYTEAVPDSTRTGAPETTAHSDVLSVEVIEDLNIKLLQAAKLGYNDQVGTLLDQGADIETRDVEGFTPLINAVNFAKLETVVVLLQQGADPNARTYPAIAGEKRCFYGGKDAVCRWHDQPVIYFAFVNLARGSRTPSEKRPFYLAIAEQLIMAGATCPADYAEDCAKLISP